MNIKILKIKVKKKSLKHDHPVTGEKETGFKITWYSKFVIEILLKFNLLNIDLSSD